MADMKITFRAEFTSMDKQVSHYYSRDTELNKVLADAWCFFRQEGALEGRVLGLGITAHWSAGEGFSTTIGLDPEE